MKSIYLKAGKTQDVFNDLKDGFNGTLMVNGNEYDLALQTDFAKGNIKGTTFPGGMIYMEFDVVFFEAARLSMEPLTNSPIFFAYCSRGSLQHGFGEQGEKKRINKQYSGILKSAAKVNSILHFEKNVPIRFFVIGIGTSANAREENTGLINKLKNTFFNKKKDYLKIRVQNPKIADKIKELYALPTSIVGQEIKYSILGNILEMEIEQNTEGFSEIVGAIHSFTMERMNEIKKVSDFVMNFPAVFATRFLALNTELFTNKLQEGFKLIPSRTIHNFLIFMKIERQRI